MKIYDNDILVSRNECFLYDRKVQNKDGSPYIISIRLTSPMLRFSIADENYPANERYILNRYLSVTDKITKDILPRFYKNQPIRLMSGTDTYATDFTNYPGDTYNPIPTDISGVTKENYAVYYILDSDGNAIYKRYIQDDTVSGHWESYSLRLVIPFGVEITKEWTSKNYTYGIFLMDGTLYIDVMKTVVAQDIVKYQSISFESAYVLVEKMSEQELYDYILNMNHNKGIDTTVALIDGREVIIDMSDPRWSPYWTIDCDIPMLNPAKITVKNDPIGGLL